MSAYGTVTCLAPAGHHPPKPSRQTRSFMKKKTPRKFLAGPRTSPACHAAPACHAGFSLDIVPASTGTLPFIRCFHT